MPSVKNLVFEVVAVDKASKVFHEVGGAAEKTTGAFSKLKVGAAAGFAIAAGAAIEFGKKSVEKFEEVGREALGLQRVLGGTAEAASRLNFAAEEKGIGSAQLTTGIRLLSKHLAVNDKAWQSVGIAARDANGKLKPTGDLLPELADKFKAMPAGAEKTALALQLFGRSGTQLLPLLNLGSEGLKEFGIESDKLGHTMSGAQLDAIKKVTAAHRQFSAAVSGVEIQVGAALYPALVKIIPKVSEMASTFAQKAIPVVKEFGAWFAGKLIPALQTAGQRIIPAVQKAFTQVTASINGGKPGWSGIANAVLRFIDIASRVIAVVLPQLIRLWGMQVHAVQLVIGAVSGVVNAYRNAQKSFAGSKLGSVLSKPFYAVVASINAAISAWHTLDNLLGRTHTTFKTYATPVGAQGPSSVGRRASGGPVRAGSPYVVGENGPELFVPGQSGGIIPNGSGSRSGATGGSATVVNVSIGQSASAEARRLVELLAQYSRQTGPLQIKIAN